MLGSGQCPGAVAQGARRAGLTVWSGLVVPLPLLALSAWLDGPAVVAHALTNLTLVNWLSTAYTAVLSPGSAAASGTGCPPLPRLGGRAHSLLVPAAGLLTASPTGSGSRSLRRSGEFCSSWVSLR